MAGYVLHLSEQENITLSAAVTRRLIDGGDGDALPKPSRRAHPAVRVRVIRAKTTGSESR